MSERIAPRPGGRATDHADAQRSDARGARHFTGDNGERADTRRSGIGRQAAGKPASRKAEPRAEADDVRGESRPDLVRGKGRRPEPAIKTRREEALEEKAAKVARDRKPTAAAGTRRPVADAPVDGTAALRVEDLRVEELTVEPVRVTGEAGGPPRLRVAPPAPISAPRAPFVASVIGVVVVGVLGILLINTKTNENSFRIADLTKQGAALDSQQQDLENQLVEASSIGNLDAAARRLGLVRAENPARFRLPDGKIIGVPRPADGRPAVTAQDAKTPGAGSAADAGAGKVAPVGGAANGQTNGAANGAANGQTNGAANGQTNGAANGQPNGAANGQANGAANGAANGQANGAVNGGAVGEQKSSGTDQTANGATVGTDQTQSDTGQ
jgi:hypothetical protein